MNKLDRLMRMAIDNTYKKPLTTNERIQKAKLRIKELESYIDQGDFVEAEIACMSLEFTFQRMRDHMVIKQRKNNQ